MFSESFDIRQNDKLKELEEKQGDLDDFSWDSDEVEQSSNTENVEASDNSDTKEQSVQNLKNDIGSRTDEYRWFFDVFPNNRHEDASHLSPWEWFQESMAAEVGWLTEKKIKWFDRDLWVWKRAEVSEHNWEISIKIIQEWSDWNHKELSISLNNFKPLTDENWNGVTKDNQETMWPTISINWDNSLLMDLLDNSANKWDESKNSWNVINQVVTLKDSPELFSKIFDSIDAKIISPEKNEFYGYVDHAKKLIESEKFSEYLLEQDDRNNVERDSNSFIEYLLSNMDEAEISNEDLVACKTLLSLCILLRNSSNSIDSIKESLWYHTETSLWKEKNVQWWEHLIEFLPINESDLEHFIACRDEVVTLAINELTNERQKIMLSQTDFVTAQNDGNVWDKLQQINKFLSYLNK